MYQRKDARGKPGNYWIDRSWRGVARIQASTGTSVRSRASRMEESLQGLRSAGRYDVLGLVASHRLTVAEAHRGWIEDRSLLSHAVAQAESPTLGELADEWLSWLDSPGGLSPRTREPYAPGAVTRYRVSLNQVFATLPMGRDTRAVDLNKGALASFRDQRKKEGVTGSTINRDLSALQAFIRWSAEIKEPPVAIPRVRMPKERENPPSCRFFTTDDIKRWLAMVPDEWLSYFLLLLHTGVRVSEGSTLTWGSVHLAEGKITIGVSGRVKSHASNRDVPINRALAPALVEQARRFPSASNDLVFPNYSYKRMRAAFKRSVKAAGLASAKPHDLRHTFAVQMDEARVPLARIQRLLGHQTPHMTLRYQNRGPANSYLAEDAAAFDRHLTGDSAKAVEAAPVVRLMGA